MRLASVSVAGSDGGWALAVDLGIVWVSVCKEAVFQAQFAESCVVLKDIGTVEGIIAEFCDTGEFPFEEPALQVVGCVVLSGLGWLDNEIINLRQIFSWRGAEEATPALDVLPRIRGTGQKETVAEVWKVDALVEAPDRHNPVQKTAVKVTEDFLSLVGFFPKGEIANTQIMIR